MIYRNVYVKISLNKVTVQFFKIETTFWLITMSGNNKTHLNYDALDFSTQAYSRSVKVTC